MSATLKTQIIARSINYLNQGWCQGTLARDSSSMPVEPSDSRAVSFCMIGAVMRSCEDLGIEPSPIAGMIGSPQFQEIRSLIRSRLTTKKGQPFKRGVGAFNDGPGRTLQDVTSVLHSLIGC